MRVLVCGSRDFDDYKLMRKAFDSLGDGPHIIIHGGAMGADYEAGVEAGAHRRSWWVWMCRADWRLGASAGPLRNQRMLDETKPDLVLAFPLEGSKGTWDMVRRARKTGVEVRVIE